MNTREVNILQFFEYEHLPIFLQEVSKPFFILATEIIGKYENNTEMQMALRKLLEAKDCAVRAKISAIDI